MEASMEHKKDSQYQITTRKGGFITMPFIIANETLEKVANVGLHVNMVLYLMGEYHYDAASAAIIIYLWNAFSSFMPLFGAFLSDSYLGRFRVIASATLVQLLGLIVLWLTAIIHSARPPHCITYVEHCATPSAGQVLFLVSSFTLMAIGAGGIRPCSLAFAADQISDPQNAKNEPIMKSFFNWYYVSVGISIAISVTVIVYIQVKTGWVVGFGITVGLMLISTLMFFLGSPLYIKPKPNKRLLAGLALVATSAWRNRDLPLPPQDEPTDRLWFLNKACLRDSNGRLCTVRQAEELKAIIRVIPIWSTGFVISAVINQYTFLVVQAGTMDRHIFNFEIPTTNFIVFSILTMTIWVAIYDRILVPFLSKHTNTKGFALKQRLAVGLAFSCLATAVAALVEKKRRDLAIREGLMHNPIGKVSMSAMWLVPQLCLTGLAEGCNIIGQIEFFYSQFPKSMSSVAVAFFSVGFGMGSVVAGLIVKIVKDVTGRGGRPNWLAPNVNEGHYDYYYGLLTILGVINLLYFLVCGWAYGSTDYKKIWDEDVDDKMESMKEIDTK